LNLPPSTGDDRGGSAAAVATTARAEFALLARRRSYGVLLALFALLLALTADHGNTEATGIGAPQQGVLCESRGERNRLFTDATFAEACVQTVPGSRIARHSGLPTNIIPVIAPAGKTFTDKGRTIVCHGGDSLEEMAVPFVLFRNHKESAV
jgi:hypothetical protein